MYVSMSATVERSAPAPAERGNIPVGDDVTLGVVSEREPVAHRRRQGNASIPHAEGIEEPPPVERFEVESCAQRERVPEQPDAEIRVFVLRADVARQRVRREKGVHRLRRVVGERVGRILRTEVRGHARKSRRLRREVEQSDLTPVALGDLHRGGKVFRDGIVEAHLAARHHVGEQGRGEGLGDGADLEHAVRVEGTRGAGRTVRDDAAAATGLEHADDDTGGELGIHALLDDCVNGRVGGDGGLLRVKHRGAMQVDSRRRERDGESDESDWAHGNAMR